VRSAVASVAGLPDRAGRGTVTGNLGEALLTLLGPGSHVPLITAIMTSRPSLVHRLHQVLDAASALGEIEASLAAYIEAEQRLGRLAPSAGPAVEAAILIGAVHHLVFTGRSASAEFPEQVRQMVTAVITGMEPGQARLS